MKRPAVSLVSGVAVVGLALTACSSQQNQSSAPPPSHGTTAANCVSKGKITLHKSGVLTIATDSPAFEPWFKGNNPSNGKGFESAVAYAVAGKLGFTRPKVVWVKEAFNNSYAPGRKDFDFDINQISITAARAKKVDFSTGYYVADQAVIVLKSSSYAHATSFADLKGATVGAQVGTTSLTAAQDQIAPSRQV
jgi:polar amino acid transport system substrate-binding protein